MARNRSVDLEERRRHAEALVRALPLVPGYGPPLSDEERAGIQASLQHFTARCGKRRHGHVLWVRSPGEFDELTRGRRPLLHRRDRLARRISAVGHAAIRAGHVLLWLIGMFGWFLPHLVVGGLEQRTDIEVGPPPFNAMVIGVTVATMVVSYGSLFLAVSFEPAPRRAPRVRPLRVRMPRGLRPGTPEFRAWLPRDVLSGVDRGPDGRVVLTMAGVAASSVQPGEFLGGPCRRSADLYPVRFREPLRLGRQPGFDGHLRPHELAWLLERGEVAPRRFTRTLLRTHAQLERAFAVRMYRDRAIVLEPPVRFRTERLPDGTSRLHCDDGAAVVWASGEQLYALHGVPVPDDLVERGWDVERIHAEGNGEVRRVAIERMGWADYMRRAGLEPVSTAPDPANGDRQLRLYAIPLVDARVLLMANGSPDRSGAMRQYAELVPSWIRDPVEAAAWQYGVPTETYRQLQRRT